MPLPANLVLRSFRDEADDEACQLLEQRANQFGGGNRSGLVARLARALIEVFPGHPRGFAAKARLCDEHEIIVVADTNAARKVIAVVVVTILSVTYKGAAIKAGWLFDLRVDEDYQRQGIGRALSEEAERRCLARGVSMIHLTVNRDNAKAKGLYAALGYQNMSLRAPRTAILSSPAAPVAEVVVMRLTAEHPQGVQGAAKLTAQAYAGVDMSPLPLEGSFLALLQSELSEGTYIGIPRAELENSASVAANESLSEWLRNPLGHGVVEDSSHVSTLLKAIGEGEIRSYAGVSMWNGSNVSNWKVIRVVFKKETWLSRWFQCALAGCAVGVLCLWGWRLADRASLALASSGADAVADSATIGGDTSSSWGFLGSLAFALEIFAFGAVAFASSKAASLIAFVVSRNSNKLRARAHAPFQRGPAGSQCLKGTVAAAQGQARDMGYGMWILNVDAEHPDSEALPRPGFRTEFMQKWIADAPAAAVVAESGGAADDETATLRKAEQRWALMSPDAYCDPRGV